MAHFAQIGIGPGAPFEADALEGEVRDAIRAGVAAARETMATKAQKSGQKVNGWTSSDAFGTRERFGGDYLLRAAGALAGWGGNDVIEALFPTDGRARRLNCLPARFVGLTSLNCSDGTKLPQVKKP